MPAQPLSPMQSQHSRPTEPRSSAQALASLLHNRLVPQTIAGGGRKIRASPHAQPQGAPGSGICPQLQRPTNASLVPKAAPSAFAAHAEPSSRPVFSHVGPRSIRAPPANCNSTDTAAVAAAVADSAAGTDAKATSGYSAVSFVETDAVTAAPPSSQAPRRFSHGRPVPATGAPGAEEGAANQRQGQRQKGHDMRMPHTHLNLQQLGGLQSIASELADSGTEFTYLTVDPTNAYKFTLAEKAPADLVRDCWVTLSMHGVSRGGGGEGLEVSTFAELTAQQAAYNRLRAMPLFSTYPLWKSLCVWREMVQRRVRGRRLQRLVPRLHAHDPAIAGVYSAVVDLCWRMRAVPLLCYQEQEEVLSSAASKVGLASGVNDSVRALTHFLLAQQQLQMEARSLLSDLMRTMLDMLCFEGDRLVMSSLVGLPSCSSAITREARPSVIQDRSFITAPYTVDTEPLSVAVAAGGSPAERPERLLMAPEQNQHQQGHGHVSFAEAPPGYGTYGGGDGGGSVYSAQLQAPSFQLGYGGSVSVGEGSSALGGGNCSMGHSEAACMHSAMGLSYTEKGAIRQKCRQLSLIFRVVDFMLRDCLYDCVEGSLQHQLHFMQGVAARSAALNTPESGAEVEAEPEAGTPTLTPAEAETCGAADEAAAEEADEQERAADWVREQAPVAVFSLTLILDSLSAIERRQRLRLATRKPHFAGVGIDPAITTISEGDLEGGSGDESGSDGDGDSTGTDGGYGSGGERELAADRASQ